MEYTRLGRTGLRASRLGLGALKAAARENLPGSDGLMDRALEHGINYLDTSDIYGLQDGDDWSENVIGRWLARGGGRRERTVLATKLGQAQDDWPNQGRLSAYQMHHIDRDTPWEEIWEAMEVLAGWHIARAQEKADARHFLGLVKEQSIYNLAVRERLRPQLTAYENLCAELGHPPARVALAWLLQRPGVTSAIVGPNTIEQLDDTVAALGLHLHDQARTRLDETFPGYRTAPHRTAPEDYAW
jgi:aryl-alcohol dehydrogenase-like predicted oxidoreductase